MDDVEPESDLREDPLYATMTKCSVAIRLAFEDAAIQMKQLSFPTGPGVTWGIFYPDGGPQAAITILVRDLEAADGDDEAIARLVVKRIEMARDVLVSGVHR